MPLYDLVTPGGVVLETQARTTYDYPGGGMNTDDTAEWLIVEVVEASTATTSHTVREGPVRTIRPDGQPIVRHTYTTRDMTSPEQDAAADATLNRLDTAILVMLYHIVNLEVELGIAAGFTKAQVLARFNNPTQLTYAEVRNYMKGIV